ncbi:MAG: restriction endonuclease, partial [Paludibacteraceae bacterium]|nr:restriction endonuclease [Paludibacteraceae bacterium]
LVIFFSILQYIHQHSGFPVNININFPLITGKQFEHYRNGFGKVRLLQIKYKYFSDKALYLWDLCYAFFERSKQVNIDVNEREYLLVKNFNIVFEAIIDELIGGTEADLPEGLKEQADGKRVDHLFRYRDLTNNQDEKPIYYIGDSKYYKRNVPIGEKSVYKQFTYARNVIQWNLDLFNDGDAESQKGHIRLNDEITEGYNIIPNFFISAEQNTLESKDDIHLTEKSENNFQSRHYDNRLFDRDTFLVAHYDVNFLFVVGLYGRNNSSEKASWRNKVRQLFRKEIQDMLSAKFQFYAMTAKKGISAVSYIGDHFQELLGKVFTPYEDRGGQKYFSLALDKSDKFKEENEALLGQLKEFFHVESCKIGDNPQQILPQVNPLTTEMAIPANFLTLHYLERYVNKEILIGCYHDQAHLDWILGKNDKGTLIYNVRLDKNRAGAQKISQLEKREVSFVILYEEGHASNAAFRVFRVHHHATMDEERMRKAWYSNPHGRYFCYVFDEEVSLGKLNIEKVLGDWSIQNPGQEPGTPIFLTGQELLNYRQ